MIRKNPGKPIYEILSRSNVVWPVWLIRNLNHKWDYDDQYSNPTSLPAEEQDNLKTYKNMSEEKAKSMPEARFNEWKIYGRKTPRFHTKSRKKFAEAVSKEGHKFYKAFLARWGKLMDSNNCRVQFHEVWQQLENKHGLEKNLLKRR